MSNRVEILDLGVGLFRGILMSGGASKSSFTEYKYFLSVYIYLVGKYPIIMLLHLSVSRFTKLQLDIFSG